MIKAKKIVFAVLLIITIIFTFSPTKSEAAGIFDDIINQGKNFINDGKSGGGMTTDQETSMRDASNSIFNVLVIIGTALVVIVGGIMGIKFMVASVEDKAKIKEAMIPYVLGAVLIFGAFGIWKLTITIMDTVIK